MLILKLNRLSESRIVKIDLVSVVFALLFVIGLLAIDSVRANKLGCTVEYPANADSQES